MLDESAEVQGWLAKADRDRRTAEAALNQIPPITDTAAFHAQQTVEKLLKAYLVAHRITFEKVHDLDILLDACCTRDTSFEKLRSDVIGLTSYAVRFRYPGPADPTVEQVQAALAVAAQVQSFVLPRLP